MTNILFVGFGLSKSRHEAVSKNTISLIKILGTSSKASIYNIGYSRGKKSGILTMFAAVLNYKKIRSDIVKISKRRKITHLYDTFVMPGASLIFTLPLKHELPNISFIKEIHNNYGFSKSREPESLIRFFLNTRWQLKKIISGFDKIVARNLYLAKKHRGIYLPPLINIFPHKRRSSNRKKLRFCYLGHSMKKKGLDELLRLLSILPKSLISEVVFTFALSPIGKPEFFRKKIEEISIKKNISSVCVTHVKPEVFFRQQDVLCLPLRDEFGSAGGFNTALEAMEAGCLVLTTSTKISKSIIQNNKNGFLVKKGDAVSILKVLKKIVRKQISISRITEKARADIIGNHSMEEVRKVLLNIYE